MASSRFRASEGIVSELPCRPYNLLTCNHANLCRSTQRQPSKNDSLEGIAHRWCMLRFVEQTESLVMVWLWDIEATCTDTTAYPSPIQ
jgi:hypothetical protein